MVVMEKSICILSHSFTLDPVSSFAEFQSELSSLPATRNPITIVDNKKYYPHVFQNKGILNIERQNIFQFEILDFYKSDLSGVKGLLEKTVYLDDEKKIELDVSSIKWMFVLDPKSELGFLFYIVELKIRSENSLETLSKTKIFRYLKEPGNDNKSNIYKLKVCENEKFNYDLSFYSILSDCLGTMITRLNFLESKPFQYHFLGKSVFSNDWERDSFCYNILRIPANPNKEMDNKYFDKNQSHVYRNSSIYAFSMAEGIVLSSFDKSPKMLVSNFLATQMILLYHRRFEHVLSRFMAMNSLDHGQVSKGFVKSLKQIRKEMNLSNFYVSLPISQYSEIQEIYNLTKINSGLNQAALNEAFNQAALLLMEEAAEANSEREQRIGLILGVLGITGFISFIFDYLVVSKNQKFIDTLDFPFNALPLLLFSIVFIFIWKFLKTGNND
jgi:hypothetical protein